MRGSIVAYVSDYVTKPGLKTYTVFDTIRSVFDRCLEMLGGTQKRTCGCGPLLCMAGILVPFSNEMITGV